MAADGMEPRLVKTPGQYARSKLGPRPADLDSVLRDALLTRTLVPMQVDDNAGRVLQLLTLAKSPSRAIEVGTYFGYSAIHIARGLPPGAILTTIEIDAEVAAVAHANFERCEVADCIDLVVADAAEYLGTLEADTFDLVFIDGAKRDYPLYLKLCVPLLKIGGLLIADDAFAEGNFDHEADADGEAATKGVDAYNSYVCRSPKFFSAFVETEHGMLVSYRLS